MQGLWIHPVSERIQAPGATGRTPTGSWLALAHAACAPPQTRRAPRPHARRRPATSHGAEALAGMALAKALDSARLQKTLKHVQTTSFHQKWSRTQPWWRQEHQRVLCGKRQRRSRFWMRCLPGVNAQEDPPYGGSRGCSGSRRAALVWS